jgi:hypothetical protein
VWKRFGIHPVPLDELGGGSDQNMCKQEGEQTWIHVRVQAIIFWQTSESKLQ